MHMYRSSSVPDVPDVHERTPLVAHHQQEEAQNTAAANGPPPALGRADSRGSRGVRVLPIRHPSREESFVQPSTPFFEAPHSWREYVSDAFLAFLPCVRWLRTYDINGYLRSDLLAGFTVGVMLVPQAMSYAKLAGLPPIYGLYAGFVPVFTYVLVGSSRQLAVGPVALVSLLVSDGLSKVVSPEEQPEEYLRLAMLLAMLVGLMEALMGLVRLGWMVRFISHSVTSGFTSGAAVIIGMSQAKYFLGYPVSRSSQLLEILRSILAGLPAFRWQPFTLGAATLALLLLMKEVGKSRKELKHVRAAGPVTAVLLGTLFFKLLRPASISVVGHVPMGLPPFSARFQWGHALTLAPTAAIITGVAVLESVGIAKAMAARRGYEMDSNQELFGLGVCNILGSMFSSYPITGSFSRSAVNNDTGAETGLSGFVMGCVILATLLYLTPLFEDIPQCSLAAIVVSAVIGLVDYEEAAFLWRVEKRDFFLWVAAFLGTMFLGIETGVLIAVGLSIVFVIYESANPHIAVLGRLPGTTVYRNIQQYPDAYTYHGIVIVRVDAPMYFANISFIKERLRKYELRSMEPRRPGEEEAMRVRFVIIEMSPVTYVDSTAMHALKELYHEYRARGIQLALSNPNQKVMMSLSRAGIPDMIGREWYFVRVHDAVQVCTAYLQEEIGQVIAENTRVSVKRSATGVIRTTNLDSPSGRLPPRRNMRVDRVPQEVVVSSTRIFQMNSDLEDPESLASSPHLITPLSAALGAQTQDPHQAR